MCSFKVNILLPNNKLNHLAYFHFLDDNYLNEPS